MKPKRHVKQHDLRKASLLRMAKEHRVYARSHRTVAQEKGLVTHLQILHRAIANMHTETAAILRAEARLKLR